MRLLLDEHYAKQIAEQLRHGVVFTSRRKLPRSRDTIGLYVRTLDEFLREHPADDALLNSSRWL